MRHNDPDAGQFTALLEDLIALQDDRAFAKAMAAKPQPPRREFVPHSFFSKAARIADQRAARADIERSTADLSTLERQVRAMAAERAAENAGERRARVRAQVRDVLDKAMRGLAAGNVTAVQVARIEAECGRVMARLEPGPALMRGAA